MPPPTQARHTRLSNRPLVHPCRPPTGSAPQNVKQLQTALRGHKSVQRALAQSQLQVAGLSAQLDSARQEVAAAQAASKAADALRSRSGVLERAWTTALEVRGRGTVAGVEHWQSTAAGAGVQGRRWWPAPRLQRHAAF